MAIENTEQVEQALGLEAGKLTEILASEESHNVDLSNRVFYSKEDDATRTDNLKKESFLLP